MYTHTYKTYTRYITLRCKHNIKYVYYAHTHNTYTTINTHACTVIRCDQHADEDAGPSVWLCPQFTCTTRTDMKLFPFRWWGEDRFFSKRRLAGRSQHLTQLLARESLTESSSASLVVTSGVCGHVRLRSYRHMQRHGRLLVVSCAFCTQIGTGQWNVNVTERFEGVKHIQVHAAATRGKVAIDRASACNRWANSPFERLQGLHLGTCRSEVYRTLAIRVRIR
jgi:hypothetical protein